jgi:hypothetical protein
LKVVLFLVICPSEFDKSRPCGRGWDKKQKSSEIILMEKL